MESPEREGNPSEVVDKTTGLYDEKYFEQKLSAELENYRAEGGKVKLFLVKFSPKEG